MGYYGRIAGGQAAVIYTSLTEGLNEYFSPFNIRDDQMSDMIDAMPYKESGIRIFASDSNTPIAQHYGRPFKTICDFYSAPKKAAFATASYSQVGTLVTLTGLSTTITLGEDALAKISIKSGSAKSGTYKLTDAGGGTYTYTATTSKTTSGNCRIYPLVTQKKDIIYTLSSEVDAASYSQSGTTVTITGAATIDLKSTNKAYVLISSGNGVSGKYTLTPQGMGVFTYTAGTSLTTSGSCTVYVGILTELEVDSMISTEFDVTDVGYPNGDPTIESYGACLFATEAVNYVVFSVSSLKKLIYHDGSTRASVSLPFYPKRLVSHANRVFAIDTNNKIWWSKAGSFKNASDWYGSGTSSSSVVDDAGYWCVEKERYLSDLAVIGNTLYVFGMQNIWAFTGHDYESFALQVAVPDIGVNTIGNNVNFLTQNGSAVYFLTLRESYNPDETAYELYEYDGTNYPIIVTHPVVLNNAYSNGVVGGVDIGSFKDNIAVASDENYVYVYPNVVYENEPEKAIVYMFDINHRTWWKRTGYLIDPDTMNWLEYEFVPTRDRRTVYGITYSTDTTDTGSYFYDIYNKFSTSEIDTPHIVTKAFASAPSAQQTLSSVIIKFQGQTDEVIDVTISCSPTSDGDDFEVIKTLDKYIPTGDHETLEVFLPIRIVARAQHYRIKIEVVGGEFIIYNIERRFRITGRSR